MISDVHVFICIPKVLDDGSVSESGKSESNDIAQVVTPRGHVVETVPDQPAEQGSSACIGKDADIESSGEKQIFTINRQRTMQPRMNNANANDRSRLCWAMAVALFVRDCVVRFDRSFVM